MKKLVWLYALLIYVNIHVRAQTNATNFKAKDCSNVEHDLFAELDAGKVIVITWVMPCGVCIKPAATSSTAVSTFQDSFPDRVLFYISDDYANTSCSSLDGWLKSYSISANAIFTNAAVNMSDYGVDGMPKTIVIGGTEHKVFMNTNGTVTHENVKSAIVQALDAALSIGELTTESKISLSPNPASDVVKITVNNSVKVFSYELLDFSGKQIVEQMLDTDDYSNQIFLKVSDRLPGAYIVRLATDSGIKSLPLVIN